MSPLPKKRNKDFHISTGDRGEMVGWNYLLMNGFKILEKNYRCALGEIDVIAEKDETLHFIEIKTRNTSQFGRPEEAVGELKQRKIIRIASLYLQNEKRENTPCSLDVLAISDFDKTQPKIQYFENAYEVKGIVA